MSDTSKTAPVPLVALSTIEPKSAEYILAQAVIFRAQHEHAAGDGREWEYFTALLNYCGEMLWRLPEDEREHGIAIVAETARQAWDPCGHPPH